jgi:hypothetical protein
MLKVETGSLPASRFRVCMEWKPWLKDILENKGKEQNEKAPLFDQPVSSYLKAKTVLKVNLNTHVSCSKLLSSQQSRHDVLQSAEIIPFQTEWKIIGYLTKFFKLQKDI